MQLGAKSLLTGMATRQHTYAMPKRGWKRLAARFRNASSEQSDARERRSRGGLKWTAFRRRPVIGNVELNRSAVVFCGVFLAATVALASRRHSRLRGDGLSWRVAFRIAERVDYTVRWARRWKAPTRCRRSLATRRSSEYRFFRALSQSAHLSGAGCNE